MSRRKNNVPTHALQNQRGGPAGLKTQPGFLMPDKQAGARASMQGAPGFTLTQERVHRGPLPTPETFADYDRVLPGAAERILKMAENQQVHRHGIESAVVNGNVSQERLGPIYGLVVATLSIIAGFVLAFTNHEVSGLSAILVPLLSLVGVFVYGKREQNKDLVDKDAKSSTSSDEAKPKTGLQKPSR
jgi:uncharacterized membrane protein